MTALKILFLDQGRGVTNAAMGHVRVQHALSAGLPGVEGEVQTKHVEVPPFNRWQRRLLWGIPRLGYWNFGSVRWHLLRGWVARRLLKQELLADRPDVVHITTNQVAFLLEDLHRQVPCVLSQDILMIDWARLKRFIPEDARTPGYLKPLEWLERRALHRAPLTIAWTDTVADSIRRFAPKAKLTTLHPGLDLEAYRPREGRRLEGPLRVLFVGGRWSEKGGPDLVAALGSGLGTSVELDVVSTHPVEPRQGLRVHTGKPGSSEVADLFARADIFCMPTSVDACPWVVLEAMASGVPVISTRVGSIPEMVGDGGIIVPPRDVDALRATLQRMLGDADLRAKMAAAGRARTEERYDARKNTPRLIELLRDVRDAVQ